MPLPDVSRALAAFLPRVSLERIHRQEGGFSAPSVDRFEGALLWSDVTGFTPLVERLSREGNAGAERLAGALSGHFGRLISLTAGEGGDLLFLAGDGALCLWRAADFGGLDAAYRQAARAALAVIRDLDGSRPQPDILLRVRLALSAGALSAFTVGGVGGRWLDFVGGQAMRDLMAVAQSCANGEIGVADRTAGLLDGLTDGAPGARRLHPGVTIAAVPLVNNPGPPACDARALATHLLPSVATRIEAGQGGFLAEFRTMTAVFADLSALGDELDVPRFQEVVSLVQATVADYEGTIYQLVEDDKGTSVVVVFGLPGCSHEDDPVRAVRFGHRLREALRPLLGPIPCGIATGPLFCGPCGLAVRRQYALYGNPMTRAARLMGAAGAELLVDEPTHRAASHRLELGGSRRCSLKGLGEVTAYLGSEPGTLSRPPGARLVGRRDERARFAERLDALMERGEGSVVLVEGPAGIGKSTLLASVRRSCQERGCRFALGAGDFVESRTAFFVLRAVFRELWSPSAVSPARDMLAQVEADLGALAESLQLLPLLGPVLGIPLDESALTRQMTPAVRAENRNRLIISLIGLASRRDRWAIAIDDLHSVDAASLALLPHLARLPGILWVLSSRRTADRETFPDMPAGALEVPLQGLAREELGALAAAALGTETVPDDVTALLAERAGGNPLYSRQLALSLRETNKISVQEGRCVVRAPLAEAGARDLPISLSALIKSRIDRLPPEPLLTLRVASVLGQSFEPALLAELLAATASPVGLEMNLGRLVADRFLTVAGGEGPPRYLFEHVTIQAVAYDLFPDGQRVELHRAAARALEARPPAERPAVYGRLAHHLTEARDHAKAAEYSALAAHQALEGYANRDAIALFRQALVHHHALEADERVDAGRARLYAGLAQAHYSSTETAEARAAFEAAIRHAGFRDPGAAAAVFSGMAFHVLRRARPAFLERPTAEWEGERRERCLAALAILGEWMALDFWEGRLTEGAAKAFMGYRLAELVRSSPLAAEAYGRFGYTLAVTPLRFLAERELRRSVELAIGCGDLQATATCQVLLGMYYTLIGRAEEALLPLQSAQPPAEKLGAGLWRHRTRFMLGETLLCLDRLEEARLAFADAGERSIGAEPPVVGLSTSMGAEALARQGRLEEALAALDGPRGLSLVTGRCLPLQRFVSLGVKIAVLTRLGRPEAAGVAADEAAALAARGQDCDVFFLGLHGHAAIAELHLALRQTADARRSCRRLRRFADLYPAARPRADLLEGRWLLLVGRVRSARRRLRRCLRSAARMKLPYEQGLARHFLAEVEGRGP
jgi:AAA ATPase domain